MTAWTVSVDHPRRDVPLVRLGLRDGAVATSTTLRRRWTLDGVVRHHLIDPRSGLPSDTDLELATVVAAEAWIAEALTKAVLLRGSEVAVRRDRRHAAEALAVDGNGRVHSTPGLAAYLGTAAEPSRDQPLNLSRARPLWSRWADRKVRDRVRGSGRRLGLSTSRTSTVPWSWVVTNDALGLSMP